VYFGLKPFETGLAALLRVRAAMDNLILRSERSECLEGFRLNIGRFS
jgi:hypothetical protein